MVEVALVSEDVPDSEEPQGHQRGLTCGHCGLCRLCEHSVSCVAGNLTTPTGDLSSIQYQTTTLLQLTTRFELQIIPTPLTTMKHVVSDHPYEHQHLLIKHPNQTIDPVDNFKCMMQ